jgi:hypothetical protein
MAEYAYNNSKQATTKISPFYAKFRFKPRTNWPTEIHFCNPASELYGHYMTSIHKKLKERLSESRLAMRNNYTKQRKSIDPRKNGELFMLNGRSSRAKHRCKKLEDKMLGPFEVLSVRSNLRYCKLKPPNSWTMHLVFNLELRKRYKGTDLKKQIIEIKSDGEDWVMEWILATGPSNDNPKQHVFLVQWKDFTQKENT